MKKIDKNICVHLLNSFSSSRSVKNALYLFTIFCLHFMLCNYLSELLRECSALHFCLFKVSPSASLQPSCVSTSYPTSPGAGIIPNRALVIPICLRDFANFRQIFF